MATNHVQDMIMLAVPVEHYPAMVQALGQLIAGSRSAGTAQPGNTQAATAPAATTQETIATGRDWPPDELQRLKAEPNLPATARALLDLLAERPETPVTLAEVMTRAGITYDDARGQLAAFTKLLRKRYGRRWPFRPDRDPKGRGFYIASKEFAAAWRKSEVK